MSEGKRIYSSISSLCRMSCSISITNFVVHFPSTLHVRKVFVMRAFFYAAIFLSWKTRFRVFAKPIATAEENLFTSSGDGVDESLFSSLGDGTSAGIEGDDMSFLPTSLDDSDLLIANDGDDASYCPLEVGLGENGNDGTLALANSDDWLTSRDLDDNTILADSKPATCAERTNVPKKPDPHIPSTEFTVIPYDTGEDCHSDHPDRLCCGIANGNRPGDCDVCTYSS